MINLKNQALRIRYGTIKETQDVHSPIFIPGEGEEVMPGCMRPIYPAIDQYHIFDTLQSTYSGIRIFTICTKEMLWPIKNLIINCGFYNNKDVYGDHIYNLVKPFHLDEAIKGRSKYTHWHDPNNHFFIDFGLKQAELFLKRLQYMAKYEA